MREPRPDAWVHLEFSTSLPINLLNEMTGSLACLNRSHRACAFCVSGTAVEQTLLSVSEHLHVQGRNYITISSHSQFPSPLGSHLPIFCLSVFAYSGLFLPSSYNCITPQPPPLVITILLCLFVRSALSGSK